MPSFEALTVRLESCRVPTICRLNGGVYGGSTDLALACDFRVGHDGVEMFMPAGRLGVHYYQAGMRRYVSRLGLNAAKRLFLTAERIGAVEMLRIGYLTEVAPAEELDARVDALAGRMADMAGRLHRVATTVAGLVGDMGKLVGDVRVMGKGGGT